MGQFGRLPFVLHPLGDFRLPFALGGEPFFGSPKGALAFVVDAAVAHVLLYALGNVGNWVEQGVVVDAELLQLLVQVLAVCLVANQADDAAEGARLSVAGEGGADAACVCGQALVQGLHQVAEHLALGDVGLRYGAQFEVVGLVHAINPYSFSLFFTSFSEYTTTNQNADDVVLVVHRGFLAFEYPVVEQGIEIGFVILLSKSNT